MRERSPAERARRHGRLAGTWTAQEAGARHSAQQVPQARGQYDESPNAQWPSEAFSGSCAPRAEFMDGVVSLWRSWCLVVAACTVRFALRVSLSGGCVRRGPACVPLRRVSVCVSRVATLGPEREATMGDLMCYVVLSVRPSGCTAAAARTLTTRACGVKTVSKLVNLTRRDRRAPDRTERAPDRPSPDRPIAFHGAQGQRSK